MKTSFFKTFCTALLLSSLTCAALPAQYQPSFNPSNHQAAYGDEAYLYRLHTDAFHHLAALTDSGDIVQLYDSSRWYVNPSQRYTVLNWVQSDELFIKPCASWFSSYKYVLFNRMTGQAVEVNLASPPVSMGTNTLYVVNIDVYQQLIQLSDNTVWSIKMSDSAFANWQIGQRVLVGVNNNWRYDAYPQILINADASNKPYCLVNYYGFGV